MSVQVSWYDRGKILLFSVSDPLTLDQIEQAAEEVWALAMEVRDPVDMIVEYRNVTSFPRGSLPVVREGHFTLPHLDRVALVGGEPMVEMMMVTLTRDTHRADPTIHTTIEDAAVTLRQKAADEDR